MSTLSRPAGRIEGCGVEPFTPFDTRSARGTLWVHDAHFCDFDLALLAWRDGYALVKKSLQYTRNVRYEHMYASCPTFHGTRSKRDKM